MASQWVTVFTARGHLHAEIIRGLLESAGLSVQLSQEGAAAAYALTVGPMGEVDVMVPEERQAEAEALLAAMDAGELDSGDDVGPESDAPDEPDSKP